MKTIQRNGEAVNYFTQAEVAGLLGVEASVFHRRVYVSKKYPKPTTRLKGGRRLYYPAAVVEGMLAAQKAVAS